MTDLVESLEWAAAGSRELDAEVEVAVRAIQAARSGLAREHWAKWRASRSGIVGDAHTQYASPRVTTSIDAAVALAERVLGEEGALEVLEDVVIDVRMDTSNGCLKSIPLALCAAIIRAHAEQVQV